MMTAWMAWKTPRMARSLAQVGTLIVGLAATQAALAEPSEREMRAAIEAKFGNVNAGADDMAQRCNNREYKQGRGDPTLAMACLAIAVGGGTANGGRDVRAPQFQLTRFEKIACEKAQGKAGYQCDYVMGYGSNMPGSTPFVEGMTRSGSTAHSRFIKQGSRWVAID